MGERGRELYGLERILDNSLMVVCGGEVVVVFANDAAAMDDATAADDATAVDGVAAADGFVVAAAVFVWVQ